MKDPFSPRAVCQALLKSGHITEAQAKEILKKEVSLRKRLEILRAKQKETTAGKGGIYDSITIIDVLTPLNIQRADDQFTGLDEEIIFRALAKQWGMKFKKLDPLKLDLNVVTSTIPRTFAMKHLVLPIVVEQGALTVATANPFNVEIMEDIARASNLKVRAVVTPKSDLIKIIKEFFGFKRSISEAEHQFAGPSIDLGNLERYVRLRATDEVPSTDHHIINAVDYLFGYAFDQRASDIHIEPKRNKSLVRMRIDGSLYTVYELPKKCAFRHHHSNQRHQRVGYGGKASPPGRAHKDGT